MNKIKSTFLISILAFVGCKSYKKASPTDITYSSFTTDQKHWASADGNISYIDKGEGVPILLLHGVPTSGWLYRKMIDPLVEKGYRVIVPDMLGYGSSDSPEGYDIYDKKEQAKHILDLMEYLKIPNWHHVMHDAGGLWTWEMAKLDNSKINKLTILNTIIYKEGFKPPVKVNDNLLARLIKWSYQKKTNFMIYELFEEGTMDDYELSKADVEGYRAPLKNKKTNALFKFFTTNTKGIPDYSETIKSIDVPVQVIWGANDKILKWDAQNERVMSDLNIKEENVHVLEDKNHFLQEEATDKLVSLISAFK